MRHADAYIREFNVAHPDTQITIQHLLMWAIAQILEQFPTMNRFVVGGRLYQRKDIWFTYSAKQSLKGKSPLIVIKRRFDPAEPFVDMVGDMQRSFARTVRRPHGPVRPGSRAHPQVPRGGPADDPRRRAGGRRVRPAPGSMIEHDPLYGSAFFANLAQIGMDACYHHLYEYGSIGIFGVIGRPVTDPGSPTSGPDRRRTMTLRWTFDERCEDGLVAGYALKRCKQILEDPRGCGLRTLHANRAAPAEGIPRRARVPRRLPTRPVR